MSNSRFYFALSSKEKAKRSLDEVVISARGNKNYMIAVAIAVIGVKQQQLSKKRA